MANNKVKKVNARIHYKKHYNSLICKLQSLKHNSRINITNENGETIATATAGVVGYKNNKKRSPSVATLVVKYAFSRLLDEYKVTYDAIKVEIKGFGIGRSALLRSMKKYGKIISITETTPLQHNGVRPPKAKNV